MFRDDAVCRGTADGVAVICEQPAVPPLSSDAAAADLRRVAALGDGAAGAEFLLAFAHYNALDAS